METLVMTYCSIFCNDAIRLFDLLTKNAQSFKKKEIVMAIISVRNAYRNGCLYLRCCKRTVKI